MGLIALLFYVLTVAAQWVVFQKAGIAGWKSIIPIYNSYCLFKIAWGNGWIFLATIIPVVGVIVDFMAMYKLAKSFNKGLGFGIGLFLLRPIFYIVLAFSEDNYIGPNGNRIYVA